MAVSGGHARHRASMSILLVDVNLPDLHPFIQVQQRNVHTEYEYEKVRVQDVRRRNDRVKEYSCMLDGKGQHLSKRLRVGVGRRTQP